MTDAREPYLLLLSATLEEVDLGLGKATIAGIATETLAAAGLDVTEPGWSSASPETARGAVGAVTLGAGPAGLVNAAIRPAETGLAAGAAIPLLAAMMRAMHEEGVALEARLDRRGPPFPLPRPPLFEDAHGLIVSTEEFMASYERRILTVDIPGVEIAEAHGRLLMLRALDAADQAAFLAAVEPGQMELARGARAGLTDYARGAAPDWADAAIRTGASGLVWSGVEEGRATWTCPARGPRPIRGFDLLDLARLRDAGRTPEGEPVSALRVVFPDQMDALQEKRPLLDLGVEIVVDLGPLGLRPLEG